MLALHPKIQEEVFQELKEVFSDDWKRAVTPDDVEKLQRLDRAIKETMRLFPPVFHMFREVPQEVKLSTCTLPAGCVVSTMAYFVHRDPRYFPDPERFDPDRFLPEKSYGRHHYSYIPFGAGQRSHIGYEFAEMQMITTLATVLRKYRVLPAVTYDSLQQLEISTVARPSCGYKLKMLPR
ncbi:cytochrome P450 4c3 [Anabrus simplex]|uniref:cytochrome P450 4c3 n=1 Tax=Anabrus simplex TaxID=316456 RepID=UPI0035A295D2